MDSNIKIEDINRFSTWVRKKDSDHYRVLESLCASFNNRGIPAVIVNGSSGYALYREDLIVVDIDDSSIIKSAREMSTGLKFYEQFKPKVNDTITDPKSNGHQKIETKSSELVPNIEELNRLAKEITIIDANRATTNVRNKNGQDYKDLENWTAHFLSHGIPALIAETEQGFAVYRTGLVKVNYATKYRHKKSIIVPK